MSTPQGRRGSVRTTLLWLAAGLVSAGVWASTFTVREGEVAIVERFGDPRRTVTEPGLHFKWPAPIDTVESIDVRSHLLDPPVAEFLTEDQKNVEIDAFVAWRVEDPLLYLTRLRDRLGADDRIGQVLQSVLIDVLNSGPFQDLASSVPERSRTLDDVRREVTELVAARCRKNEYGVEITMVGIERISFPQANKAAVERSMSVKREESAALFRAQGNERAAEIETAAKLEAEKLIADAKEAALKTTGESKAEVKRIEGAAIALNEELYWRIQHAEIAENALRGATLIFPANHPLTRVFEFGAPEKTGGAVTDPDDESDDEPSGDPRGAQRGSGGER